jgi:hypothetical protein
VARRRAARRRRRSSCPGLSASAPFFQFTIHTFNLHPSSAGCVIERFCSALWPNRATNLSCVKGRAYYKQDLQLPLRLPGKVGMGSWVCPVCTFENNGLLSECELCQTAKVSDPSETGLGDSAGSNNRRNLRQLKSVGSCDGAAEERWSETDSDSDWRAPVAAMPGMISDFGKAMRGEQPSEPSSEPCSSKGGRGKAGGNSNRWPGLKPNSHKGTAVLPTATTSGKASAAAASAVPSVRASMQVGK